MRTDVEPEPAPVHAPDRDRVIFVDDEPHVLAALRRMLRCERERWDVEFASSAAEALEMFKQRPVSAIVSDMQMPGMNGAQLLSLVQRDHPATARLILSGQADRTSVIAAIRSAQQFLAKPCDVTLLVGAVTRALAVRRMLTDPNLRELIGAVSTLPTLPAVYHQLVAATDSPQSDLASVATILSSDVATSAEVLKLVNSAFFGLPRQIATVEAAVTLLGLDNIRALVLTGSVFRMDSSTAGPVDVAGLRERALRRAAIGRLIANREGWGKEETDFAVLACMLRDVGALVLAEGLPEAGARLARWSAEASSADPQLQAELEQRAYGCTVPQAGAYLLGLWGFAPAVVHAVAGQPTPAAAAGAGQTEHLVAFAHLRALGLVGPVAPTGQPGGYLSADRLLSWNAAADEVLRGPAVESSDRPGSAP